MKNMNIIFTRPLDILAYKGFISELTQELRSDGCPEEEVETAVRACNEFVASHVDTPGDFEFYFDEEQGALLKKGNDEYHPFTW